MIRHLIFATLLSAFSATRLPAQAATDIPREQKTTPATTFHDPHYGVTFQIPTGWNLTRRDAEFSTFSLDVRTAPPATRMRGLATIAFNPHPRSTFSGALFYFSVTPRMTESQCRSQAAAQAPRTVTTTQIAGTTFNHGYDEHGAICTESRDEIYTALRNDACYRFDLILHNFCGGDVSGVRDMTPAELNAVRKRLESILTTVAFDKKQSP